MADIGEKLRDARKAKGLSIADIEKATKIQGRYLTAIENDDFDKLPGEFYVRAFIRQYAQIVGLNGKELLSDFHKEVPESKPDKYVENSIDNKSEEVRETTHNKKGIWRNYLPRIAIGLVIVVVLLIAYMIYARLSGGNSNNAGNQNSGVTVSSQSGSKPKPKKKIKTSSVKIKPLANGSYRVTGLKTNRTLSVRAGSQSITSSVDVDGVNSWSQTLAARQRKTITLPQGARRVTVHLSNDEGSKVTIGGKKVPFVPTGSNRTITLVLGKKKASQQKQKTKNNTGINNGANSTSTNANSGTGGSSTTSTRSTRASGSRSANTGRQSSTNRSSNSGGSAGGSGSNSSTSGSSNNSSSGQNSGSGGNQ